MIADRPHPQTLPLLPAFLCVLAAGWATTVVFQLQGPWATRLAAFADPQLASLGLTLVGALVGAWAVRVLLRGVCGFAIPYWRAYGALVAGDLVGLALVVALLGWARHTAGSVAADALPELFGPQLLGLLLTVYLIQRHATPLGHRAPAARGELFERPELAPRPRSGVDERDLYDEIVSAARDSSLGLVDLALRVPPAEASNVIANGLLGLGASIKALEERACPVPELAECHASLVQALKRLQDDLVEAAAEAARSASDRLLERGAVLPSMADVSDQGARYRWSLSQSAGLKAVKDALDELGRHGIGTTW